MRAVAASTSRAFCPSRSRAFCPSFAFFFFHEAADLVFELDNLFLQALPHLFGVQCLLGFSLVFRLV